MYKKQMPPLSHQEMRYNLSSGSPDTKMRNTKKTLFTHARDFFRFMCRTRHLRRIRRDEKYTREKNMLVGLFLRSHHLPRGISVGCSASGCSRSARGFTRGISKGCTIARLGSGTDGFARGVSVRCPVA